MTAHILIVGGGINGLASAWTLVRKGYRVSLFDQGPIPKPGLQLVRRTPHHPPRLWADA